MVLRVKSSLISNINKNLGKFKKEMYDHFSKLLLFIIIHKI